MTDANHRKLSIWIFGILFLISFALAVDCQRNLFYNEAHGDTEDLMRVLALVPVIFLTLAIRAFRMRNLIGTPWKSYLRYVVILLGVLVAFFISCHTVLGIKNWLYYIVTGFGVLMIGQKDGLPEYVGGWIEKLFGTKLAS